MKGQRAATPGHVTTASPVMSPNLTPVDFKAVAAKGAYVYCYLRADGSPYYVGMSEDGTGKRPFQHHAVAVPRKHPERVRVMRSGLTGDQAREWEKLYIARYGCKYNNTGILRNQTEGGEGAKGAIRSDETKAKQSAAARKRYQDPAERAKASKSQKGKHAFRQTAEWRARMSALLTGRPAWNKGVPMNEEQKAKVSASRKGIRPSAENVQKSRLASIAYFAEKYGWDFDSYLALTNAQRGNLNRQYRRNAVKAAACGMTVKAYTELAHAEKIALGKAA